MKSVDFLKVLGLAACVAVASSAYAQNDTSANTTAGTTATAPAHAQGGNPARRANRKLGYAVRRALAKAQGLDVSNITVRARGGAVTLTGSVPEQAQIEKAGEVAQGVAGVTSVANKLSVVQE